MCSMALKRADELRPGDVWTEDYFDQAKRRRVRRRVRMLDSVGGAFRTIIDIRVETVATREEVTLPLYRGNKREVATPCLGDVPQEAA